VRVFLTYLIVVAVVVFVVCAGVVVA